MLHRRLNLLQRLIVLPAITAYCRFLSQLSNAMVIAFLFIVLLVALHHTHLFRLLRRDGALRRVLHWGDVGRLSNAHGLETFCVLIVHIVNLLDLHWLFSILRYLLSISRA